MKQSHAPESPPMVAVIILNWNQYELTSACLDSVSAVEYPADRLRVIVVDNGSTDGSSATIRARHARVTLLDAGENLGYAEGNNLGIRHALDQGADYVCVLNNDTIVEPSFLQALLEVAEGDPDVGMVGPKIYFSEPPDMVFSAGSVIDWDKGELVHRGIWQREDLDGPLYSVEAADVDFVVGCCVLVRRAVVKQIGLLDSRYYLNFEDVDWCVRARDAGWRVRYTPNALLWHQVSASLGQASPGNTYYMTRNSLLFFWTHLSGWRRWRAITRIAIRYLGHIAVWTLRAEYRDTARAKRDSTVLALRDALLGRFGEMGPDVKAVCRRT